MLSEIWLGPNGEHAIIETYFFLDGDQLRIMSLLKIRSR